MQKLLLALLVFSPLSLHAQAGWTPFGNASKICGSTVGGVVTGACTSEGATSLSSLSGPLVDCPGSPARPYCSGGSTFPGTSIYAFLDNLNSVVQDQSGAATIDTGVGGRHLMVFTGSGHTVWNNAIYILDVDTKIVTRVTDPSGPVGNSTQANPDGTAVATHTQQGLVYLPNEKKILKWGLGTPNNGNPQTAGWLIDMAPYLTSGASPTWVSDDTLPDPGCSSGGNLFMDTSMAPVESVLFLCYQTNRAYRYNPTASSGSKWTQMPNGGSIFMINGATCAVDPIGANAYCPGARQSGGGGFANGVWKYSVAGGSLTLGSDIQSTLTGCGVLVSLSNPGFKYDSIIGGTYYGKFVYYPGTGNTVTIFDQNALSCSTVTYSGGPTDIVADTVYNGVYDLFTIFPSLGKFVAAINAPSQAFSLAIDCVITTTSFPAGTVGQAYSQTAATSGCSSGTWAVASGSLPSWASLNTSTGAITGTVSGSAGTATFTLSYSGSTSSSLSIVTNAAPAITTAALVYGTNGLAYAQTLAATGGTAPLTWSISSGSVPGLTMSSSGVYSGTPTTTAGNPFSITVLLTDANSITASATFPVTVGINGQGNSTYTCQDRDGDGYGTGASCTGPDADDTDPTVHTSAQFIAKYGTLTAGLAHLGYNPLRIWYVATTGNDTSCISGSAPVGIGSPCATSAPAINHLLAGDAIIWRAGSYSGTSSQTTFTTSGTSTNPIIALEYPGELVSMTPSNAAFTINDEHYLIIDGFQINSSGGAMGISGGDSLYGNSTNTFHDVTVRHIECAGCWRLILVSGYDNLLIEDSVAHDGSENGFYVGSKGDLLSTNLTTRRDIAYKNAYNGFHVNGNQSGAVQEHNLSYSNLIANFDWQNGVHNSTFDSNLSISPGNGGFNISEYLSKEGLPDCGNAIGTGTNTCVCPGTFPYNNPSDEGGACNHDQTGNVISNYTNYTTTLSGYDGSTPTTNVGAITIQRQISCTTANCLAASLGSNTFDNIIGVAYTDGGGNHMPIAYIDAATGWPQSSTYNSLTLWNSDSTHSSKVFGYGPATFGSTGYTCASPPSGVTLTNCINADPKFTAANPTWYSTINLFNLNLSSISPAAFTGTTNNLPAFDLMGNPFVSSPNPSMGAYTPPVVTVPPISVGSITTTATQAVIPYSTTYSGGAGACTLQSADMDRGILISSATGSGTTVTVTTVAPHGLLAGNGTTVRIEGTGLWDGWRLLASASGSTFTFASTTSGTVTAGNVGVLTDDLNTALYPGSNLGSRAGNTAGTFVVGLRSAPIASDSNRYSRALQANARYLNALTCGSNTLNFSLHTQNIPVGGTYNDQTPQGDPLHPGQYSYQTIQWSNLAQALIDPTTGIRSYRATGPLNTLAAAGNFISAFTPGGGWSNASVPPSNGSPATYAGTCGSGTCPLFLRADTFTLTGGATYTASQSGLSLDSFTVTVNNAFCTTGSCSLSACLTIASASCASTPLTKTLTNSPALYTFGSQGTMDLWQQTGTQVPFSRVDASVATGTFSYVASTGVVTLVSGNKFSANWVPGSSTITFTEPSIAGNYVITAVQENSLTITGGPAVNVPGSINSVTFAPATGGTSYVNGASLIFSGGGCTTTPVGTITAPSGSITAIVLTDVGVCSSAPTVTVAAGTGQTLTAHFGGSPFIAPNFGVLLTCTGQCSVGTAQYIAGSSPQQSWPADSKNSSSPPTTLDGTTTGKPGYDVFVANELFWFAADGSQTIDMGAVAAQNYSGAPLGTGVGCGTSNGYYPWDSDSVHYPDTWYCLVPTFFDTTRYSVMKVQYMGAGPSVSPSPHVAGSPNVVLTDCANPIYVSGPCLKWTQMQPLKAQSVSQNAGSFNPDYAASGFTTPGNNYFFGGISPEGQLTAYVYGVGQDTPGWIFVYNLGDRTPMGTDGGSMVQIAAVSTYRQAPASWCTIHDVVTPAGGWLKVLNNGTFIGGQGAYVMTLSSAGLSSSGSATCPANPFGVPTTGNLCDTITVSGQPASAGSPSTIQNIQQGDMIIIGALSSGQPPTGGEVVRVLTAPTGGGLTLVVQRGAAGSTAVAHLTGVNMTMECGTLNSTDSAFYSLFNFASDPSGQNPSWATVIDDSIGPGGHGYLGGGIPNPAVTVLYGNTANFIPTSLCPSPNTGCFLIRNGYVVPDNTTQRALSINPTFAGKKGLGDPNNIDTHPGACFLGWCMDARPVNGASSASLTFALISGKTQLYKSPAASLNRKFLPTFAFVGKRPLVDISGPGSTIADGAGNNYEYCYVNVINECVPGSAVGDVYLNAPFVSNTICPYPGVAVASNDDYPPCVGDMGAFTASLNQWGYLGLGGDLTGATQRRIGSNYNQWTQFSVFWASQAIPSGLATASNVPWLNGVRTDDLVNVLPPYPSPDGVTRGTFQPINVTVPTPPAGIGAATAIIEFGYPDYANGGSYFNCTSRQETCVAVTSAINQAIPFYFETSESTSYSGVVCTSGTANGCPISIPALGQHVLHYRYKYLNSGGAVVATGREMIIATP